MIFLKLAKKIIQNCQITKAVKVGILIVNYMRLICLTFRMMMVITWLLNMAGFVLIFAELGWKWTAIPISENPHPLLGLVTTGLCFIQPFMALVRPHPGAST